MLTLNFKKYGESGEPILILHGFLGSLDNWHSLATEWSKNGFTVYAIDLRNHGKSPHTQSHSITLMADDILHFTDQHDLRKINLLGHSMGGKVAMQFALQYPDKINKLIVVDIAPKAYQHGAHDAVFEAIFHVKLGQITSRKEAETAMLPYLGDFGTRQFILKSLDRTESGFQWKFNIDLLHREYEQAIAAISNHQSVDIPTMFVRGGQSLYVKEEDLPGIKQLFPQSDLVTISNAGHWVHADQPKEFTSCVLEFLHQ